MMATEFVFGPGLIHSVTRLHARHRERSRWLLGTAALVLAACSYRDRHGDLRMLERFAAGVDHASS